MLIMNKQLAIGMIQLSGENEEGNSGGRKKDFTCSSVRSQTESHNKAEVSSNTVVSPQPFAHFGTALRSPPLTLPLFMYLPQITKNPQHLAGWRFLPS